MNSEQRDTKAIYTHSDPGNNSSAQIILITGVTGFVGRSFARYFYSRGYRVFGYGRKYAPPEDIMKYLVGYCQWDITEKEKSPKLDFIPNFVIHCAGSVTDWGSYEQMHKINTLGTQNVSVAFPNSKLIHISTASIYDPMKPKRMIAEDQGRPRHYISHYQTTKWEAEQEVVTRHSNYIILRPHIIYGPGDTTIYPRLMRACKHRWKRFILIGTGTNHISLTYIENLAYAVELSIQSHVSNQIFNIADQTTGRLRDILDVFQESLGAKYSYLTLPMVLAKVIAFCLEMFYILTRRNSPPLITRYAIIQMSSEYTLSIQKAKSMLGYEPKSDYTTTLSKSYGRIT